MFYIGSMACILLCYSLLGLSACQEARKIERVSPATSVSDTYGMMVENETIDHSFHIDMGIDQELLVEQAPLNGADTNYNHLPEGFYIRPYSHANVIRTFEFLEPDEAGHLRGFNLDHHITLGNEEESCGVADRMDPQGKEGVDNQLGVLWTILEPLVGEAVEALIANAIKNGNLLLMIELSNVQDLRADSTVSLSIFRGSNKPVVNAKGLVVADQTFQVDSNFNISVVEGLVIEEGHVRAGPIEFAIPIEIFDVDFPVQVRQGQIDFYIDENGYFSGLLGGEIIIKEVLDTLLNSNAEREARLVQPIFESNADLGYENGQCKRMSAAFGFVGTTAFVMREHDFMQE